MLYLHRTHVLTLMCTTYCFDCRTVKIVNVFGAVTTDAQTNTKVFTFMKTELCTHTNWRWMADSFSDIFTELFSWGFQFTAFLHRTLFSNYNS